MKQHLAGILERYDNRRLLAIDVFRGLTITAMILANNPGSWAYVYAPLRHAQWHGWTPTDLIFPFFIVVIGWSIYASNVAQLSKPLKAQNNLLNGLMRAIKLFGLGLFLALFFYNFNDPDFNWLHEKFFNIRIMGVLQRIAIVYFVSLFIVTYCRPVVQYFVAISLLLVYIIGVYFIPYSDVNGLVYQGDLAQSFTFIDYLDTHVLTRSHLYLSSLQPFASDPEGLFSTLPAIVSCLSGVWLAAWMHKRQVNEYFCFKLIFAGALLAIAGGHLHSLIPINKPMWTPSYVLLSSGLAIVLVGLLTYLIDIKKWRLWSAPFVVFGTNSIAFFMFAGILARILLMIPMNDGSAKQWFYSQGLQPVFGNYLGSLAFAMLFLSISYLAMYGMYRRSIFWKV